jgi:hypothetical protein
VRVNPFKNDSENSDDQPQELSFMRPIEARTDDNAEAKPSRAERRAAKGQGKTHGKVPTMRNQAVANHRNFSTRRSG